MINMGKIICLLYEVIIINIGQVIALYIESVNIEHNQYYNSILTNS